MSKTIKSICRALPAMLLAGFAALSAPTTASAQDTPYIGKIMLFGGNFCPRGYAAANGQLVPIASNDALFSLLGTVYGGDGRTTFALPDLRGRTNIHNGDGPGLTPMQLGEKGGAEQVTITVATMPSHSHGFNASSAQSTGSTAPMSVLSVGTSGGNAASAYSDQTASVPMSDKMIGMTGGSQPHTNVSPVLGMTWCIATVGLYPSRN